MSDPSTVHPRRQRTSEDPWTLACRVVHDLRRDGIAVASPDTVMPTLAHLAAAMLAALGVAAVVPDEPGPSAGPGIAQPGGGWISGPSSPPASP
jgi:hypothetical protein